MTIVIVKDIRKRSLIKWPDFLYMMQFFKDKG